MQLARASDISIISLPAPEIEGHVQSPLVLSVVARSDSGQTLSYEWKKDGKILKGQTANSFKIEKPSAKDEGVYQVNVKNSMDSKTMETKVSISHKPLPKARKPASSAPAMPPGHCHP